jgi:hypothetical protein
VGGGDNLGVAGEPEVVVGAEVEDLGAPGDSRLARPAEEISPRIFSRCFLKFGVMGFSSS